MSKLCLRGFAINVSGVSLRRVLMCLVLAAVSNMALAQAGQLDPTFANKGIFLDNFNGAMGMASAVVLQSDGKIVAAGVNGNTNSTSSRGVVVRLNTNGTLDSSFGSGGSVTIKFGDINDILLGMAIQTDGKILLTGTGIGGGSGFLVRLNTNGSFDTTFGGGGFVSFFPSTPGPFVIQPDGKIVVVGSTPGNINSPGTSSLQRFNTNGQLDTTFGKGGTVPVLFGGAIALQANGKFLIASGGLSGTLARYNSNGSLDTTYGISGQQSALAAPGLALQSDGRLITAGSIATKASSSGNFSGFGVMRFATNGTVDATFGTRGGAVTPFPSFQTAGAFPVVIQSNGDIVAGGSAGNGGTTPTGSFALARYLSTGKLDTTFGTGGLVTTSFGNTVAAINALAIQTDGKIVAAGSDGAGNFVVARYLGQ